jgi:endonuclease YncB( thermonuclease family)
MAYKFGELSKEAQEKAIKDYMNGWLETHPDDAMTRDEANETLAYAFEHDFDINGNYLGES